MNFGLPSAAAIIVNSGCRHFGHVGRGFCLSFVMPIDFIPYLVAKDHVIVFVFAQFSRLTKIQAIAFVCLFV